MGTSILERYVLSKLNYLVDSITWESSFESRISSSCLGCSSASFILLFTVESAWGIVGNSILCKSSYIASKVSFSFRLSRKFPIYRIIRLALVGKPITSLHILLNLKGLAPWALLQVRGHDSPPLRTSKSSFEFILKNQGSLELLILPFYKLLFQ